MFVPGHGDVGNLEDVADFQNILSGCAGCEKPPRTRKPGDALVTAVLPELTEKYGSWAFFQDFSRSNILDRARNLKARSAFRPARKSEALCWFPSAPAAPKITPRC